MTTIFEFAAGVQAIKNMRSQRPQRITTLQNHHASRYSEIDSPQ